MKLKKLIALTLVFSGILLMFSSCGYEIIIRKKGEGETTLPAAVPTTAPSVPVVQGDGTETTSEPFDEFFGYYTEDGNAYITVEGSYEIAPMSAVDILSLYKSAVDNVKLRAPGYVKNEYQDVLEVNSFGEIDSQLADNIIDLVASEVLVSSGDEASMLRVLPHDDIAVMKTFPLYGMNTGCEITSMNIIRSAVCYENDELYRLVINFDDQLNPEPYTSEFGKIMTPIARANIADNIAQYLVVLDMNQYQFDINYTGNELICTIDKDTNHMLGLTQKMIMNVDINLNLDLMLFTTKSIKVSGKILNHLEYYDFNWD